MGSADMMTRNLDGRVEILVSLKDPSLVARIEQILEVEMNDDALAWELRHGTTWIKRPNERGIDTHATLRSHSVERSQVEIPGSTAS
jgi:polyphosphate kinase